jgi:hypothetical protein
MDEAGTVESTAAAGGGIEESTAADDDDDSAAAAAVKLHLDTDSYSGTDDLDVSSVVPHLVIDVRRLVLLLLLLHWSQPVDPAKHKLVDETMTTMEEEEKQQQHHEDE